MSLVHSVEKLKIAIEKILPPNWIISGECTATSSGVSEAELSKVEYVTPPQDGIQEFELHVPDSSAIGAQVLTEYVPFLGRFDKVPEWCRGIRIRTATNAIEWRSESASPSLVLYGPKGERIAGLFKGKLVNAKAASGDWPFPLEPEARFENVGNSLRGVLNPDSFRLTLPVDVLDSIDLREQLVDAQGVKLLSADTLSAAQTWRCERRKLASYTSWVQFKVKKLRLYKKERTTIHSLEVCYADPREAIEHCLNVGFAAAVAAFVASGGAAAAPAFEAAFKTCIAAAGISLSQNVQVSIQTSNEWSGWKRV